MRELGIKCHGVEQIRKLKDGTLVPELDNAIDLSIHTKCPFKWILIDMETGQKYIGSDKPNLYGKWQRLENNEGK